ncbi:MAG: hypothetical protein ACLPM3_02230 [Terracidiphilus sp.]
MKKFVAVLFILLCSTSLVYGQKTRFGQVTEKPNPADYSIKVHITASHLKTECINGTCNNILYADTILNGKKIEIMGIAVVIKKALMLIRPSDYQVKLTKDNHNSDSTLFGQEYDLLLPDNTVWHCYTTGISE